MSAHTLTQLRNVRLEKANALRNLGISPYPSQAARTHYAATIIDHYPTYEGQEVTLAGRLMSLRKHGGLTFADLQDQTGKIQLFVRRNNLKSETTSKTSLAYQDFKLLDVGDIVEATGLVGKTEKGEISLLPHSVRILTKSIRPLPEKWAGLTDRESILRRRYLDTTLDPQKKRIFESIAKMLAEIRIFLSAQGFLEFHTPIIQAQYGGGTAKPFMTHVNALGCSMYLAISHELYLKRLIAAGFDKVYTIGRYFRNEGIDRSHHPEFSMIETMTAYENYEYNMDLIENLFRHVAQSVFSKTEFTVRGHTIDFAKPWQRISMIDAVTNVTGIDFRQCKTVDDANAHLTQLGIQDQKPTIASALVRVFEEKVESTLIQPTLLFGHPMEISPLAKPMDTDPDFAERFEVFIGGMECGDNWSEQNDPIQLLERWKSRYTKENIERGEAHPLDYDFIEVLEYGMPPTTGIGPGIERMAMIFLEQENIDEVIFFPMMRPTVSDVNKEIYGIEG